MSAIAPFLDDDALDLEEGVFEPDLTPAMRDPGVLEREIEERLLILAREREVPDDLRLFVEGLADELALLPESASLRVDPYLLLAAQRAMIRALRALDSDDEAWARRETRVRLEQIRQVYRDLAEGGPTYEDRSAKEIAAWLADVLDVSQARLAELFGVSARTFQRWVSETDPVGPEGNDASTVRIVARIVNHLRHVLTGPGVVRWFELPRAELDGRRPLELLGEPESATLLATVAASARSSTAA